MKCRLSRWGCLNVRVKLMESLVWTAIVVVLSTGQDWRSFGRVRLMRSIDPVCIVWSITWNVKSVHLWGVIWELASSYVISKSVSTIWVSIYNCVFLFHLNWIKFKKDSLKPLNHGILDFLFILYTHTPTFQDLECVIISWYLYIHTVPYLIPDQIFGIDSIKLPSTPSIPIQKTTIYKSHPIKLNKPELVQENKPEPSNPFSTYHVSISI